MVALFLWLGFWQLDRAQQKEQEAIEREDRGDDGLLRLTGNEVAPEQVRYRQVELRGEFLETAQFLLDNRKHKQVAGYYVMVPMMIEGSGRAVLVNRGWIAQGDNRGVLPQIQVPSGLQQLTGVVRVPAHHGFRLGDNTNSPLRLYIDLEKIGEGVGVELLPFVVRQQSSLSSDDGLIREWKLGQKDGDPGMHYGYALQWFAFALLLIGGWVAVVVKQRRESATGN